MRLNRLRIHLQRWSRSPWAWASWGLQTLGLVWMLRAQLQRYLGFQAEGVQGLRLFDDLLTPWFGSAAVLIWVTAPLAVLPGEPQLKAQQLWPMWAAAPGGAGLLRRESFWLALVWQSLPVLVLTGLLAALAPVAITSLLSASIGVLLLGALALSLSLLLARHAGGPLATLGLTTAALWFLLGIESLLPPLPRWQLTPFQWFAPFREGSLPLAGLLALPLLTLALFLLAGGRRRWTPLAAAVLAGMAVLAAQQPLRLDREANSALTAEVVAWAKAAPLPQLRIVSADTLLAADLGRALQPLRALRPELQISHQHPSALPAEWQEALTGRDLLWVELDGRLDLLPLPQGEPVAAVLRAWRALAERRDQWVLFSDGQGERSLSGKGKRDLRVLAELLKQDGYPFVQAPLAGPPPGNARLLVLASPSQPATPLVQARIQSWLAAGGHLLWLREPQEPVGWEWLEQQLGVQKRAGVVRDAAAKRRGAQTEWVALVERFPAHPAVAALQQPVVLPLAAALEARTDGPFASTALLSGDPDVSLAEVVDNQAPPAAGIGPLHYGWALERRVQNRDQRVVVIGDGDFAADFALQSYGNTALIRSLLRWLLQPESLQLGGDPGDRAEVWLPTESSRFWLEGGLLLPLGGLSAWALWRRHQRLRGPAPKTSAENPDA